MGIPLSAVGFLPLICYADFWASGGRARGWWKVEDGSGSVSLPSLEFEKFIIHLTLAAYIAYLHLYAVNLTNRAR